MDVGFETFVDGVVFRQLDSGVRAFDSLLLGLPGVYPLDALASLARLAANDRVPRALCDHLIEDSHRQRIDQPQQSPALPPPHPLDYCWRFNRQTSVALLDRCQAVCGGGSALLLGAPSILASYDPGRHKLHVVMVDSDGDVLGSYSPAPAGARLVRADLRDGLPAAAGVSVVVADPPWYPEYMRLFLWESARVCQEGGHVFLVLPPLGTRPGIADERGAILQWAETCGLRLSSLDAEVIRYTSPPFEQAALIAGRIFNVPRDWRQADLALLRVERPGTLPPRPIVPIENRWQEARFGQVRIRVRLDVVADADREPELDRLIEGDVLPAVSRRNPLRSRVIVWTSCNRIYGCRAPEKLLAVLKKMERMYASGSPRGPTHGQLARDLWKLIDREQVEMERYYGASVGSATH